MTERLIGLGRARAAGGGTRGRLVVWTVVLTTVFSLTAWGCALFRPDAPPTEAEPEISVFMHETGETRQMPIEEYIAGVVAGEMHSDWPVEALAAQAIIARTFTWRSIQDEGGTRELHGTDVSTDPEEFQAYNADEINDRVRQAVELTRGEMIVHNDRLVRAWFHSCSGGHTATPEEGLGFKDEPAPYLDAREDFPCEDEEKQSWQATFTKGEIAAAARAAGHDVDTFNTMEINETGPSGRAMAFELNGTTIPANELRLALGSEEMRSTWLTELQVTGDSMRMAGKGFGHGVGMSQFGALELARQGRSPAEIVGYYYQGAQIQQRWQ